MDRSYVERNRATRERLAALAEWSDEELSRPLEGSWTVGAGLAHLAYWDGRSLGMLEAFLRHGIRPAWGVPGEADAINDVRLPLWLAMPPREALREAIRAAEAIDALIESLDPKVAGELAAEQPRAVDRSPHRSSHLDEIEQALRTN